MCITRMRVKTTSEAPTPILAPRSISAIMNIVLCMGFLLRNKNQISTKYILFFKTSQARKSPNCKGLSLSKKL